MDSLEDEVAQIEAFYIDFILETSAENSDIESNDKHVLDDYGTEHDSHFPGVIAQKLKIMEFKDVMEIRLHRDAVRDSVLKDVEKDVDTYDREEALSRYAVNTDRIITVWRAMRGNTSKEFV